jgi:hypothetical protein
MLNLARHLGKTFPFIFKDLLTVCLSSYNKIYIRADNIVRLCKKMIFVLLEKNVHSMFLMQYGDLN